jgi:hypothetical protein
MGPQSQLWHAPVSGAHSRHLLVPHAAFFDYARAAVALAPSPLRDQSPTSNLRLLAHRSAGTIRANLSPQMRHPYVNLSHPLPSPTAFAHNLDRLHIQAMRAIHADPPFSPPSRPNPRHPREPGRYAANSLSCWVWNFTGEPSIFRYPERWACLPLVHEPP